MINLEKLKATLDASIVFYAGKNKVILGDIQNPDEIINRIYLILNQTLDALGGSPFATISLIGDKRLFLIFKGKEVYGVLVKGVKKDTLLRTFYDLEGEVKEKKLVEKPIEKIEEKTEIPQEITEVTTYSEEDFNNIKNISANYLGDFTEEIVNNTIGDLGISREKLTRDNLLEFIYSLQKSAAMLIGPSKAENMKNEMINVLKEK